MRREKVETQACGGRLERESKGAKGEVVHFRRRRSGLLLASVAQMLFSVLVSGAGVQVDAGPLSC